MHTPEATANKSRVLHKSGICITKTQLTTWNRFVPNKTTISFQRFDRHRQFYPH